MRDEIKENLNQVNNVCINVLNDFYDIRYEKDAYDLTKISDDESKYIRQLVNSICEKKLCNGVDDKVVTLLDYGCGDGRLHPLYEDISQKLLVDGFLLRVFAVDPSRKGLNVYMNKCIQSRYNLKLNNTDNKLFEIEESFNIHEMNNENIEICFICSDISILNRFNSLDNRVDLIVSAGVICHILGGDNRRSMLNAYKMASSSLFISQPTNEDFSSTQIKFQKMRDEKKFILDTVKGLQSYGDDSPLLKKELSVLNENLKDAQEDGEIYYSAGWVRRLSEKLPEYKDVKLPYFGTTVELAKKAVEEVGYKYVTSMRGAFGNHKRWIVTLASDLFEVTSIV